MTKKKWVSFTFRVAVTLLLFVFLFKSLSWQTLFAAIAHSKHLYLLLGLLAGALGVVVSSYQWQNLLRAEQIRVGLTRLVKLYLVGTGFSHFLPTGMGGDVVKAFYTGRASGNYAGSASAVVMTRLTGFFGMQFVAFSALLIYHAYFKQNIVVWAILLSLLVGSMIGGVILLTTLLPKVLKRGWTKNRLFASAIPVGEALIKTIRRPRLLCNVTSIGVVFWILSVLNYYTYAFALNMHVPLYFYFVAIPIVSLVAFLPVTINGFGLRESAFVYFYSTMGVPVASSLLLALMMDVQVLFFGVIGGCLYLTMGYERRIIKQGKTAYNHNSIAEKKANITWFTKEDQDVFNLETLEFDDSTPTLPMMLLSVRPSSAQGEQAALIPYGSTHVSGQQRFASSPTPVLQESRPKAVFGKNRRVILIRDEDKAPIEDEKEVPTAMAAGSFQADRSTLRGL